MTDVGGSGRFEQVLQQANEAVQELREKLSLKTAEIGQEINAAVDKIQSALDEIWFAREQRRSEERAAEEQTEEEPVEEPQPSGDPNDPAKSGGKPPKPSPKQ